MGQWSWEVLTFWSVLATRKRTQYRSSVFFPLFGFWYSVFHVGMCGAPFKRLLEIQLERSPSDSHSNQGWTSLFLPRPEFSGRGRDRADVVIRKKPTE